MCKFVTAFFVLIALYLLLQVLTWVLRALHTACYKRVCLDLPDRSACLKLPRQPV